VPRAGIAYVPQGRRLFAEMTVAENIEIGLMARRKGRTTRESVLELFPLLRQRLSQRSGTLSGGEQQMLAMARALCLEPKVLLLDEPTEGLMPSMIQRIRETVSGLRARGVSTILVEQRVDAVLPVADRVAFIENGRNRETVDVEALRADPAAIRRYVGVG
jgi:branched-chain amino acid transport system ATP-binding protein